MKRLFSALMFRLMLGGAFILARLPYRLQMVLGRSVGRLGLRFAKSRRHITKANLRYCFPKLSDAELEQRLQQTFESAGMGAIETIIAWFKPKLPSGWLQASGLEHLAAAQAQGKGVLILGAHMTCLEVVGRLAAEQVAQFQLIYRQHTNPRFEALMSEARQRYVSDLIIREDVRKIIRSLRQNKLVWYAPDQDFGADNAVFAPFFNRPAATTIATSRLVKMTGCTVVPVSFHRLEHDQGYWFEFHPPWQDFPSGDDLSDATRVNAFVESVVRQAPEQYLWQHRRFKNRPQGEDGIY